MSESTISTIDVSVIVSVIVGGSLCVCVCVCVCVFQNIFTEMFLLKEKFVEWKGKVGALF